MNVQMAIESATLHWRPGKGGQQWFGSTSHLKRALCTTEKTPHRLPKQTLG